MTDIMGETQSLKQLLDIAARADAEEGIRQGMEDAANGRTRPASEYFEEFETKNGTPR